MPSAIPRRHLPETKRTTAPAAKDRRYLPFPDENDPIAAEAFRRSCHHSCCRMAGVAAELAFVEAYGYQFKIRYADKIFFDINIDKEYLDYTLPSLSLQPLIDNAVKHNAITSRRPMRISISVEDGVLIVSNPKSPLVEPAQGTGIGLKNLNSRWELIADKSIEIINTDEEFIVRLPLLKPNN